MRVLLLLLLAVPAFADTRADSLLEAARTQIAKGDVTSRIAAVRALDAATYAAPKRADVWLEFGRAASALGRFERARTCFERATRLAPHDAAAWSALGGAWKDEWVTRLDRAALDRARECYVKASALAPYDPDALTALAMLAVMRGEPRAGLQSALKANALDPSAPEPMLALGAGLFRVGALALADSAFHAACRHASPEMATRLAGGDWPDPDLTTPENEVQLDYETRCALVTFLFAEGDVVHWDERAELFVRYGPPAAVEYDPSAAQLGWDNELEFHYAADAVRPYYAPPAIGFPYDMQVWHYPGLGMDVELWDRFLTRDYQLPYSRDVPVEPGPDLDLLARRTDLMVVDGGRGVFRATAPNSKPYPLIAACAAFPSERGVRLVGSLGASAAESTWGAWALADSNGRVVARETQRLDASGCSSRDAFGSFTADVPPGRYRVDFSVWDGRGRRGVEHLLATASRTPSGPRLSDLLLLCRADAPLDRLEPAFDARVDGSEITLYCEIDGLLASTARPASFAYRTRIFALDGHGRRMERALYDATREEQNAGPHRRQFVSAPVRELAAGHYELVLEVTDHASETTVSRSLTFTKGRG